jgi:hypothetical protein
MKNILHPAKLNLTPGKYPTENIQIGYCSIRVTQTKVFPKSVPPTDDP